MAVVVIQKAAVALGGDQQVELSHAVTQDAFDILSSPL